MSKEANNIFRSVASLANAGSKGESRRGMKLADGVNQGGWQADPQGVGQPRASTRKGR